MEYNAENNLNLNDSSYDSKSLSQIEETMNSDYNYKLNEDVFNDFFNNNLNKKRNRDEISNNLNIINKLNNTNYDEITKEDLNKILTISFKSLDLGPIIRDENGYFKRCLTFCKIKKFSYICSKINTLKKSFFKGNALAKRNEEQTKLFNNIKEAIINAKYAYYKLNEHGLVDVETGTITNLKAKEMMEEFRVEIYILLKKLSVSLNTTIAPLC